MEKKFTRTTKKLQQQFLEYVNYNNGKIPNISNFCEYCDINRKTFYAHFQTMDELIASITITQQLILKGHYEHYMCIDPTRDIRQMVHYFNLYMVEQEPFFRIVFSIPSLYHIYDDIFEFFCSVLGPVFEPIKFTDEQEMSIVIRCFSYALYAPYQYATTHNIPFTDDSLKQMTLAGFNIHEYIKVPSNM